MDGNVPRLIEPIRELETHYSRFTVIKKKKQPNITRFGALIRTIVVNKTINQFIDLDYQECIACYTVISHLESNLL